MFTVATTTASVTMPPSVHTAGHTSIATSCDAPANMRPLISAASSAVRPFCAATVPNAADISTTPGSIGSVRRMPSRMPAAVKRGALELPFIVSV